MTSHSPGRKSHNSTKVRRGHKKTAKPASLPSITKDKALQRQPRHKPRVYTVAHSFTATHSDELSVERFQKVVGKAAVQDGQPEEEQWIVVENEYGATGLVPMVILEEQSEPEPVRTLNKISIICRLSFVRGDRKPISSTMICVDFLNFACFCFVLLPCLRNR